MARKRFNPENPADLYVKPRKTSAEIWRDALQATEGKKAAENPAPAGSVPQVESVDHAQEVTELPADAQQPIKEDEPQGVEAVQQPHFQPVEQMPGQPIREDEAQAVQPSESVQQDKPKARTKRQKAAAATEPQPVEQAEQEPLEVDRKALAARITAARAGTAETKSKSLRLLLRPSMYARLKKMAKLEGLSVNMAVEEAITEWLDLMDSKHDI